MIDLSGFQLDCDATGSSQQKQLNRTMDDSLPANQLDSIHGDLVRYSGDSGYLETSYNSDDDSFASLPKLTALYPTPESDVPSPSNGNWVEIQITIA